MGITHGIKYMKTWEQTWWKGLKLPKCKTVPMDLHGLIACPSARRALQSTLMHQGSLGHKMLRRQQHQPETCSQFAEALHSLRFWYLWSIQQRRDYHWYDDLVYTAACFVTVFFSHLMSHVPSAALVLRFQDYRTQRKHSLNFDDRIARWNSTQTWICFIALRLLDFWPCRGQW